MRSWVRSELDPKVFPPTYETTGEGPLATGWEQDNAWSWMVREYGSCPAKEGVAASLDAAMAAAAAYMDVAVR